MNPLSNGLIIKLFVDVVLCSLRVDDVCFVNITFAGILVEYFDFQVFLTMLFHRQYRIFKMLFDSLSQLARLARKQKLIVGVVEHKNAAMLPRDEVEIRKSINVALLGVLLFDYRHIRLRDGYANQYFHVLFFTINLYRLYLSV